LNNAAEEEQRENVDRRPEEEQRENADRLPEEEQWENASTTCAVEGDMLAPANSTRAAAIDWVMVVAM